MNFKSSNSMSKKKAIKKQQDDNYILEFSHYKEANREEKLQLSKITQKLEKLERKHKKPDKFKSLSNQSTGISILDIEESESSYSSEQDYYYNKRKRFIQLQIFDPAVVFERILNRAHNISGFLQFLRIVLGGYSGKLDYMNEEFGRRWNILRNSNCEYEEYVMREKQLRMTEKNEFQEAEAAVMQELYKQVCQFKTKVHLVDSFMNFYTEQQEDGGLEYAIDEEIWIKYHNAQKLLLQRLMDERDFVEKISFEDLKRKINKFKNKDLKDFRTIQEHKKKEKERKAIEVDAMEDKIKLMQKFEKPKSTKFGFSGLSQRINYDQIFNQRDPFSLQSDEIYYMAPAVASWLEKPKIKNFFSSQENQKQAHQSYTIILKQVHSNFRNMSDDLLIVKLLEITCYIQNVLQYSDKAQLKLLHPLDLLLVVQIIKKQKLLQESAPGVNQQFHMIAEGLASSCKRLEQKMEEE